MNIADWFNQILAFVGSLDVNAWLDDTLAFVRNVDPLLRSVITGLGMFCETSILIGLIIPGDSFVLVASTAVTSPVEFIELIVAILIGSALGESLGFYLGRFFGPKIRHSKFGRRVGEVNWHRAEIYLERRGGPAIFISRFLPVLHSIIPITVGMSPMSYRRFIAWTMPACLVWSLAYVSVGAFAAGSYDQISSQLKYAGYIFAGIVAAFLLFVILFRRILSRRESGLMVEAPTSPEPENGARE